MQRGYDTVVSANFERARLEKAGAGGLVANDGYDFDFFKNVFYLFLTDALGRKNPSHHKIVI